MFYLVATAVILFDKADELESLDLSVHLKLAVLAVYPLDLNLLATAFEVFVVEAFAVESLSTAQKVCPLLVALRFAVLVALPTGFLA